MHYLIVNVGLYISKYTIKLHYGVKFNSTLPSKYVSIEVIIFQVYHLTMSQKVFVIFRG